MLRPEARYRFQLTEHPALAGNSLWVRVMTMDNEKSGKRDEPTLSQLFPGFNEEQLKEAEENLERYLELVLRIYNRIRSDPAAHSEFRALTALRREATIKAEKVETQ
jgi:hypothetical protein